MINTVLIDRLESLALLKLSESERSKMMEDLKRIVEMIDKIQELDTVNVEPLRHITESKNQFRKDIAANSLDKKLALRNAPKTDGDFIIVPPVIER